MKTTKRSARIGLAYSGKSLLLILALFVLSNTLCAHGDLHEKIQRLSAQIEADPTNTDLYLSRGQTYQQHEDYELAIDDYNKVLSIDDEISIAHLFISQVLFETQQAPAALEKINYYLQLHPGNLAGLQTRAKIHSELGHHQLAAEDHLSILTTTDNLRPELFVNAANSILAANPDGVEKALQIIDNGIAEMGFLITLYTKAIDIAENSGHITYALEKYDEVITQMPRKENWQYRKAQLYEQNENYAEALVCYTEVLKSIYNLPAHHRLNEQVLSLEKDTELKISQLENTR